MVSGVERDLDIKQERDLARTVIANFIKGARPRAGPVSQQCWVQVVVRRVTLENKSTWMGHGSPHRGEVPSARSERG